MYDYLEFIKARFPLSNIVMQRQNLVFVSVEQDRGVELITHLRDYHGYRHLVLISAVDYIERGVFQLTYLLHNYTTHQDIGIRIEISRAQPVMDSIHHLWAAAQVYQRELREMFGIDFPGSPDVEKPMILEGWDNLPPMRRDFDSEKYSTETYFPREGRFTRNPKEEMEKKLYPIEAEVKHEIINIVRKNRTHN